MKITFNEPDGEFTVSSVQLIWNSDVLPPLVMTKSLLSNQWVADIGELSEGRYEYRFLINDRFSLNDPSANMYKLSDKKLWSLIAIDENGCQLFNNEQYTVNIESIQINNDFYSDEKENQTDFSTDKDEQAVIRYEFTDVTGAHTASVLWLAPDGNVSGWAEEIITDANEENQYVWFSIDFAALSDICSGRWSVLLFIDGQYICRNDFVLKFTAPIEEKHFLNMSV